MYKKKLRLLFQPNKSDDASSVSKHKEMVEVDWLSSLPESLICQVLLNLPTKDVVKTSVLSIRWRNLWKYVPGLDLNYEDFQEYGTFLAFIDSFLSFNSHSRLQRFKLNDDSGVDDNSLIQRCINTVLMRKVQHLDLWSWDLQMPQTLYTCESLVCLRLSGVTLATPKFVSLPSLKVMDLSLLELTDELADDLALETLISRCPVLENLSIKRSLVDVIQVLRVCSQSLLSFTLVADGHEDFDEEDLVVVIDAPRLEYLQLTDYRIANFLLKNSISLVEVCVDTVFNLTYGKKFDPNDVPKRSMIRNFLVGISRVKVMTIASDSLEVIYDYSRCESLPLFRNLSFLRVEFTDYRWQMLPIFLASCPKLKTLVMTHSVDRDEGENDIVSGPWCLLSSLKYVKIERPLKGEAKEMKLVSYLLQNSPILKKVTLCFHDSIKEKESTIFRELLTIPRLSSSCQVVVL